MSYAASSHSVTGNVPVNAAVDAAEVAVRTSEFHTIYTTGPVTDIAIGVAAGPANIHALAAAARCTTATRLVDHRGTRRYIVQGHFHLPVHVTTKVTSANLPVRWLRLGATLSSMTVHADTAAVTRSDQLTIATSRLQGETRMCTDTKHSRSHETREPCVRAITTIAKVPDIHAAGPMMTTILGEHR